MTSFLLSLLVALSASAVIARALGQKFRFVFPFLAHSIMSDAFAPIRTIIDSGQPLAEALAHHFGVPPALIRKLGSKPLPSLSGPRTRPHHHRWIRHHAISYSRELGHRR